MTVSRRSPQAKRVILVVPPSDIVYFHAILEGYDDLAVMRTIEPESGLVEVYVSPGAEEDFSRLIRALREEGVPLREAEEEKS
jgi:hypothetical protein